VVALYVFAVIQLETCSVAEIPGIGRIELAAVRKLAELFLEIFVVRKGHTIVRTSQCRCHVGLVAEPFLVSGIGHVHGERTGSAETFPDTPFEIRIEAERIGRNLLAGVVLLVYNIVFQRVRILALLGIVIRERPVFVIGRDRTGSIVSIAVRRDA